ncbi:CLH domain-containing protein [Aspergillus clavatus NRRL 1]|uniref:Vacuolar assembly protein, putative n=1 Tax=Aspergillus clavatus (strain ATCC 1007 / CBS 513.65 / DSM 816 / NCTC 3887 / NRRL 1 / QM 1276 / 107) TaxID=344612 RepID=A1CKM2_ASPCL|nr:vacuolar assembly protein, putative [Aspergillus clavatus NRRL 1]EAW09696.1 vacuolar assembly protein, putative [Aspergillus clavatus NRRL 1]
MDAPGATEPTEDAHQDSPAHSNSVKRTTSDQSSDPDQSAHEDEDKDDDGNDDSGRDEDNEDDEDDEDDQDDEDEEEEEPQLKYLYLTKHLGAVYRNGDATSSFLTAGDKMIIGTHNGNIHVLSLPLCHPLRVYHAHSASVTSISVSPFPPPLPNIRPETLARTFTDDQTPPTRPSFSTASLRGQSKPGHHTAVPATPSNAIHIATSSIDGHVCVSSLVDSKDIMLRNFGRPVQAVALSPEYKSDRTFLSGGRAGDLILTTGGRLGASTNSTTMGGGAAAAASSWLGSIGLGGNAGKDTILHSGEGAISMIKWSRSGKYVVWVNEEGIKIMRSNLHLDSADSELAWKRISHIDRPNGPGWEEMASVWKARAEWVDEDALRWEVNVKFSDDESHLTTPTPPQVISAKENMEKLVVGWGGTVWIINVYPDRPSKSNKDLRIGSVEVSTILRTDCVISGISLYTPNLIAVLAYIEADEDASDQRTKHGVLHPGPRRRPKGLEPELRIIDIESKEELSADTLTISRYENLTSSDYHMCVIPPWKTSVPVSQRGALETLGNGLWDATMYPARLFSSAASIRSTTSSGDKGSIRASSILAAKRIPSEEPLSKEVQDFAGSAGPKLFIHSPYDSVVAVKRDLSDRLAWLDAHDKYQEAWTLLEEHPEAAGTTQEILENAPGSSTKSQSSLGDFFTDDRSSIMTIGRAAVSPAADQEKRRIGELWIQQLLDQDKWDEAATVCAKAIRTAPRWEYWARTFIKNDKFDEISHVIPVDFHPPLSSNIYEEILGHYVSRDRRRFSELLATWAFTLFDVTSVTTAIEAQLDSKLVAPETEDWRILMNCLAKLYLVGGHYSEALHCYIRLQDADTAMTLIKEHRLLDALSDDIPAFILIRVSKEQMKTAPISELEEMTAEPIKLLVSEAYTGIVRPETVVTQLQEANRLVFLYFYLRALWRGESLPHNAAKPRRGHGARIRDAASKLAADEGKALVDNFADIAVELFADYDRSLLMEFLQVSTAYSFDTAVTVCESRRFTSELIYLLSKMGQTKKALNLILSDLKDVSQAISFAKSQDDPDLWEDLLDYSMDKPRFIHGLLVEAGTSIDPIKLVRRIPSGLEIEGLREGLTRMIREHDLQASISQGAAKVLQSEVAIGMDTLRKGQQRGIKFNIAEPKRPQSSVSVTTAKDETQSNADTEVPATSSSPSAAQAGRCAGCHLPFQPNGKSLSSVPSPPAHCGPFSLNTNPHRSHTEKEILVGFACGHVFHLSHVHPPASSADSDGSQSGVHTPRPFPGSRAPTLNDISSSASRTVGAKVTTARLLRDRIGNGCRICVLAKELESIGDSEA